MTCGKRGELLSLGGDILGVGWVLLGPGRANVPIQECQLELEEGETSVTGAVLGKAMAHSLLKESCKCLMPGLQNTVASVSQNFQVSLHRCEFMINTSFSTWIL